MKDTHVLIPLSLFDTLKAEYDAITGTDYTDLFNKALLTGKMSMFYDPAFTRISIDEQSEEFLKNESNYHTLKLSEV